VLWSEELHRGLQVDDTEDPSSEQLQRRALLQTNYALFREQHHELQLQLLARQSLVVDLVNSSSARESEQLISDWTVQLRALLAGLHEHASVHVLKHGPRRPTWLPWAGWTSSNSVVESDADLQYLTPHISRAGGARLHVFVPHHAFLKEVIEWLAQQPLAQHIHFTRQHFPHAGAGKRILFEGSSDAVLQRHLSAKRVDEFERRRDLDGRGELIGSKESESERERERERVCVCVCVEVYHSHRRTKWGNR